MNPKPNWLPAAVVMLAVVNLVTLGLLWFGRPKPPPRRDARGFLVSELQLDATQVRRFDSLRRVHFAEVDSLHDEMHRLKDALFARLPLANGGTAIADSIGNVQAGIERSTFNHFAALRQLCNPQQQQSFDRVINDVLRTMRPGGEKESGERERGRE